MAKIKIFLDEDGADDDGAMVVSLDTSSFDGKASGASDSKQVTEGLRAEYAIKIRGTRVVKDFPANPEESYAGLKLSMFPGAVPGEVLLEGRVIPAETGESFDQKTGVLLTDDGQIHPDDMLFAGFTGQRVQVVKSTDGIIVRKMQME